MQPREPRRKVLIDARLRQDCGWSEARILNISRGGLMARAPRTPARGSYVEISRGSYRIVARVVWVRDNEFGARAQDAIAIDAMAEGEAAALPAPANFNNDRRGGLRGPDRNLGHERSRRLSRWLEFMAVTALGCAAAFFAFDAVLETLSRPLNLVEAKLGVG